MTASQTASKALAAVFVLALMFISTPSFAIDTATIDTTGLHSMIVDNAYMLEKGRAQPFVVIDARTKEEYGEAHIFSAISIPEGSFQKSMNFLPADKGTLMVVYCGSKDGKTCTAWVGRAQAAGYTNVVIYADGFQVWKGQHMPVAPLEGSR